MASNPVRSGRSREAEADLVAQTYERLRGLIVAGKLSPGSRIIETDLAERLGVSRTPVRSALQRLQQDGFVEALDGGRNARLVVSPLTTADARELLILLGALEGIAARGAAALPDRERKALAEDMVRLDAEFGAALKSAASEPDDLFRLHSAFHQAPLELAGTPRVRTLHGTIRPQAERYRRVYITSAPQGIEAETGEHRPIIEAIRNGDGPGAQAAMQENWIHAAERLSSLVERFGDRGSW